MDDVLEVETARMFVLLDEWARLAVAVMDGKASKEVAFDHFDKFAKQFGVETFMNMLLHPGAMNHVDNLKVQYGGTVSA
jgi:hypothetical protein